MGREHEKEGWLRFVPRALRLRPVFRNVRVLNRDLGHWRSVREGASVDRQGRPIPWYTYPAIEYVNQLDLRACRVWEYGSGNSSLYYASRAAEVICVEHKPEWHALVTARAPKNCRVRLETDPDHYVRAILDEPEPFDIVVIDGTHRETCCGPALEKLRPAGMIILDNSDTHPLCGQQLRAAGLIQVDMAGFVPIGGTLSVTSFFLTRGFNLKSRYNDQPRLTVGP